MSKLPSYIARYGPVAGPKLYHALQSRAAYIGANSRRRRAIESLTGRAVRVRRVVDPKAERSMPLLPDAPPLGAKSEVVAIA